MRKRLRPARLGGWLAVACAFAGCVDIRQEVFIRRDGSCRVTVVAAIADPGPLVARMGLSPAPEAEAARRQQALARARRHADRAARATPGARVEKVDLVEGRPDRVRTVYEFPDVNAVDFARLSADAPDDASAPGRGDAPAAGDVDNAAPPARRTAIRYDADAGTLSVDGALAGPAGTRALLREMLKAHADPARRDLVRRHLPDAAGQALHFAVRVEGAFAATNARHVNAARDTAILLHLPVDAAMRALLERAPDLHKAAALGDDEAAARALEALVPGLKLEAAGRIDLQLR